MKNTKEIQNFTFLMTKLAENCDLEFDGGHEDNRLFVRDSKRIDVYAPTMSKKEYSAMEKLISNFSIERKKYSIGAWNDCSGYDYWANGPDGLNYIQITVYVKNPILTKREILALKSNIEKAYDKFSRYHNIEDYHNSFELKEAERRAKREAEKFKIFNEIGD